jgi:hypothetical protein
LIRIVVHVKRRPYGVARVVLEVFAEGNETVCGIYKLWGRSTLGPKAFADFMRKEMTTLERIARDAGCTQMRVAGRDWSRVLTDYHPMAGDSPNLLFKRLT